MTLPTPLTNMPILMMMLLLLLHHKPHLMLARHLLIGVLLSIWTLLMICPRPNDRWHLNLWMQIQEPWFLLLPPLDLLVTITRMHAIPHLQMTANRQHAIPHLLMIAHRLHVVPHLLIT